MNLGSLNKRILFQSIVKTTDGMGGFTYTWKDEVTCWAAIWPLSASEAVRDMQIMMLITHKIRIRFRSEMYPSWRIKFGDRYFSIVSIVNPNEAGKTLDLLCKESS
jgi:SPP1 family predicted phage head-tail adaptor